MSEQPEQINLKESVICLFGSFVFLFIFFQLFFIFLLKLSFWAYIGEFTDKEVIGYFGYLMFAVIIFLKSLSCFIRESIKISRWSVYKIKKRR